MIGINKRGIFRLRVPALVLALMMTIAMTAAAVQMETTGDAAQTTSVDVAEGERRLIASSNAVNLYYTSATQLLEVEDKASGYIWRSGVESEQYAQLDLNEYWKTNLTALFNFTYCNSKKTDKANTMESNSRIQTAKVVEEAVDNGLDLKFQFTELGISLRLEIRLEEDAVRLTVPEKSVKESKHYKLVSLQPLPFFGAATAGETGYLVYPDGSGALHYFNEKPTQNVGALKLDIYGSRTWEDTALDGLGTDSVTQATLPIFGMCREKSAFVAMVEDDAYESTIEVSQNGVSVPFERVANTFTYRRTYTVIKPDVKGGESRVVKMESSRLKGDRSITYAFLPAARGYSGMATRYREHLLSKGQLVSRIDQGADVPLMLDLFMGVAEDQLLMDKYITMTDFTSAQEILSDLQEAGVADVRANLIGWQSGGYGNYPDVFSADSHLGGNKGLTSLIQWAQSADIQLTLQHNLLLAKEDSGLNKKSNCVYTKGSALVTNTDEDCLIISPVKVLERFAEALTKAKPMEVSGFNLEGLGQYLYPDYNINHPVTRAETANLWREVLQAARKEVGYVSLVGGGAHLLDQVDFLHNVPSSDAGYFMTDETLPLYQMVVHGNIPYTIEEPGNLFYDSEKQWLQMLEYGAVPYFQITENSSGALTNTEYNFLFTSRFDQWKDELLDSVTAYNTTYKGLYASAMVEHKRLSKDVVRVTYENGVRLYVNYGENPVEADGVSIGALAATVVEG